MRYSGGLRESGVYIHHKGVSCGRIALLAAVGLLNCVFWFNAGYFGHVSVVLPVWLDGRVWLWSASLLGVVESPVCAVEVPVVSRYATCDEMAVPAAEVVSRICPLISSDL
jgi:hypothetical protein